MPQPTCPCEGQTLDRHLQPTMLGLLCSGPLHGYALVELLKESPLMNGSKPDPSGVYRLLASLEKEGLVDATWEESTKGPAKCQYGLTKEGKACLEKWIETLDTYQKSLVELVAMLRKTKASSSSKRSEKQRCTQELTEVCHERVSDPRVRRFVACGGMVTARLYDRS